MEQGIFVLFVIVVLVAIAVGMYFAAQRRKELAAWARSKGLPCATFWLCRKATPT